MGRTRRHGASVIEGTGAAPRRESALAPEERIAATGTAADRRAAAEHDLERVGLSRLTRTQPVAES